MTYFYHNIVNIHYYNIHYYKSILTLQLQDWAACDPTRSSAKNATTGSLAGIEPAIPVQRSNQLSYRETVVEL